MSVALDLTILGGALRETTRKAEIHFGGVQPHTRLMIDQDGPRMQGADSALEGILEAAKRRNHLNPHI